jgi:hypothetical protein
MIPNRPQNAICGRPSGPLFRVFHRHRWYGQCEDGSPPYPRERFLVTGSGTPNLYQVGLDVA